MSRVLGLHCGVFNFLVQGLETTFCSNFVKRKERVCFSENLSYHSAASII